MSGFTWNLSSDAVRAGPSPSRWSPATPLALRLGGGGRRRGLVGHDPDPLLALRRVLELHLSGRRREHRVVPAEAGAGSGKERHPPLADDDRAGRDELAVADLDAETLADRVAAVLRAGTSLLVGHRVYSSFFVVRFGFAVAGFASAAPLDRKSTRLNSSHMSISYAVFCLKKKK